VPKSPAAGRSKSPDVLVAVNQNPSSVDNSCSPAGSLSQGPRLETSVENEVRSNLGCPVTPVGRDTSDQIMSVGAVTHFSCGDGRPFPSHSVGQHCISSHFCSSVLCCVCHCLSKSWTFTCFAPYVPSFETQGEFSEDEGIPCFPSDPSNIPPPLLSLHHPHPLNTTWDYTNDFTYKPPP
jgi:hypothetical protein